MIVDNIKLYDGSLIRRRFAYKFFKNKTLPIGNIIAFRCPVNILNDETINDTCFDDAINFCWELPNIDCFGSVCFQRLFNTQIAHLLSVKFLKKEIEVNGNSFLVKQPYKKNGITIPSGRINVSYGIQRNNVSLSYTGINIKTESGTDIYDTGLSDENSIMFMRDVVDMFYQTSDSIFIDSSKLDI